MNRPIPLLFSRLALLAMIACFTLWSESACAAISYIGVDPGIPIVGATPSAPHEVFGKEFSQSQDLGDGPNGVTPDKEQLVAWDGSGGTANGVDYSGTRPNHIEESQIDAIANHRDALFDELLADQAHLLFSIDQSFKVVYPGPAIDVIGVGFAPVAEGHVTLGNGSQIGRPNAISVEHAYLNGVNPSDLQQIWASPSQVWGTGEQFFPTNSADVDGLEVWGPEPGAEGDPANHSDANKYSLETDIESSHAGSAVSIWNGGPLPGKGEPYLLHDAIVAAVTAPVESGGLGPLPTVPDSLLLAISGPLFGAADINIDALIVQDRYQDPNLFQVDPVNGNHDRILFSISQIADPSDPDGFYATGSELWVLDATGAVSPLFHGGHAWDHAYALSTFGGAYDDDGGLFAYDINALEIIGGAVMAYPGTVPEPTAVLLLTFAAGVVCIRRVRLA